MKVYPGDLIRLYYVYENFLEIERINPYDPELLCDDSMSSIEGTTNYVIVLTPATWTWVSYSIDKSKNSPRIYKEMVQILTPIGPTWIRFENCVYLDDL